MYAVVSTGGKQYRVEAGSTLTLERLDGDPGASITFDRVLLIGDGEDVTIGTPLVTGASVSATVIGQALGPKLVIFKFKQKVKYRRRTGHRQHLTRIRIDTINPAASATRAAAKGEADRAEAPIRAKAAPRRAARPRATRPTEAAAKPTESAAEAAPAKPRARRAAKPKAEE